MAASGRAFQIVNLIGTSDVSYEKTINSPDFGEAAIVKKVLHDQEIHLSRLRFASSGVFGSFLESQFIAAEDFGKKRRALMT
jgi:hypothetical protein